MHEMAVVRDIVDLVVDEAERSGAHRVTAVYLTIGYARDIVEDIFEGLFEWMARDTIAAGAELVVVRVPLTVKCNDCGNIYHIDVHDETTWLCALCGKRDYHLHSGREFYINRIEVEQPSNMPEIPSKKEAMCA